ncbi:starvation-inducible DNA-binding protein [Ereboglobus sp. PH5-5]|uniref:DNA starvation/stationary phase protection protein Dps n=1 Tax=unclassified Ereboglobus TaxID=2626932 RepID=UPI002405035D|nr:MULTISPECIES: DNA starvation/stationary phase protection protein Dps [unclassified Ereboglobus]MDF9828115.1 starvation-inducible DNA-binding protein [Ereboglobus sp. PH5-10]MDF9833059.1 starvation-inducible DNA-binding protein [Ereboglobus sp. PH5-5]
MKKQTTMNDIPSKTRAFSIKALNQTLADVSDLYSQTKQAHWNVRGPYFYTLHKLFDDVAAAVEEPIDALAERIVQLGGVAEGTVRMVAKNSGLSEFKVSDKAANSDPLAYAKALAAQYAVCAKSVRKKVDATADAGDAGTSDLLTGVSNALDKSLWFIEAHTR